jgi:two-component system, NarL family, response regulator DesR
MAETGPDGWHAGAGAVGVAPPGCASPPELAVIRVLVAEDARQVRETLVALLSLEEDIEVAAALASGDQVVAAALEHRPDVALLDIGLPGTDGITAAAELARRLPACRVLILTGMQSSGTLSAALRAGVSGYLLKDDPAGDVMGAIRAVARGERIIDPRLGRLAPDWPQGPPRSSPPGPTPG